jgi:glycosyltransferase involved in cell wall biosynthesis
MISNQGSVVVDLRCLQDPNYIHRGVGRHALALLRNAPHSQRIVGLTDPMLPPVLPEAREAVDVVYANAYAASASGMPRHPPVGFVMLSPMTHDPLFSARLLSDPTLLRAAVVHDFIPHRLPDRYLPTATDRLGYAIAMRWLGRCNLFLSNSRSSADDLIALLGVAESAVTVTGCSLDPVFEPRTLAPPYQPRHVLVVGGGDPRKNPDVVISAHARSRVMQDGVGIPLVVAGNYTENDALAFRAIATAAGGRAALIEVPGHVSDDRLLELYRKAIALVVSSRDEGFSIPLIEGMAAGVPCLASNIRVHAELVKDPDCRFLPNDYATLCSQLEQVVMDAAWREGVLARQSEVWPNFRAQAVADRFWGAVARRLELRPANILRGHRPRVALLSPLPPDRSGVADYTAATCGELGRLVDLHIFSETPQAIRPRNTASIRPLSALPSLTAGFDRVIGVIGNSHFHTNIFEILRRYGGACIAHDARMLGFYRTLLGKERALAVASGELGRLVSESELNVWLGDEAKLEALFLGEIAESAAPTIVHSLVTARMFKDRYGVPAAYLPFSIYRPWAPEELTRDRRAKARLRLGLVSGEIVIVTFGFVHVSKAPEECVWALKLLRDCGIPARLHFVGAFEEVNVPGLRPLVANLELSEHVLLANGYVSDQTYRDYLVGADLAVQLRTYDLGGLSGALLDCAAAGLPTVTNASLAEAVGVPDYVRRIPNSLSPSLLAEALADLLAVGLAAERPEPLRRAYSEERHIHTYARGLCHSLALEVSPPEAVNRAQAAA